MSGFISYNSYKKEYALNETYESFEELYELASDVYESFTKFSFKKFKPCIFYNIKRFIKYDYVTLKEFLDNVRVGIVYDKNRPENYENAGAFIVKQKNFRDTFKCDYVDQLENSFDYIIVVFTMRITTILHELQHAYDFYRSDNKYDETKKRKKFIEKTREYNSTIEKLNKGIQGSAEFVRNEIDKINKIRNDYYTSYHRQQDEISAHFVQTLPLITFYVKRKGKRIMRNIKNVWYDFRTNYPGYNELTQNQRKKLARNFSNYYYKVKEEMNVKYIIKTKYETSN